ncbi:MAG: AAA family ATPase [Deltaproteobacteria bacterium]|nr:MAG: AAA family ATPase [Deltaproteobacteria bacterium]
MLPEIAAFQICVISRKPVHLWGESGIGKTAVTNALAEAVGEKYWPVIMSIREPSDQGGLPVINHEDKSVWMAPPKWAVELAREGKGIVHLDELNVAAPTVQNSGLRVVNEGWAGDQKLPDDTSFIACGNPPETNPGVYALTPAMANRFCHIEFPIDHAGWCDGMMAGFPTPDVIKMTAGWEGKIPEKRGLFADFMRKRVPHLHDKPKDPMAAGRAWKSPRTWLMSAELLAAANGAGYGDRSDVARILVEGCVGKGGAKEFFTWLVNLDLRDPEEYLADPLRTPIPSRQDKLSAMLSSVAAASLNTRYKKTERLARYYAAWDIIARVADDGKADVAVPASRVLIANMPPGADIERFQCEAVLPMLKAAKIDASGTF